MTRRAVGVAMAAAGAALTAGTALGATGGSAVPGGFPVGRFLEHWWVFPAAVAFSTVALAAGVSGALCFSPFFVLGDVLALVTEFDLA